LTVDPSLLYISDLDGTLLLPSRTLGRRTREVLERFFEAGGRFTVATGRSAASSSAVLGGLRLPLAAIVHNGALTVCLESGAVSRVVPLAGEVAGHLFARALDYGMTPLAYALADPNLSGPAALAPPLYHGPSPNEPTRRYLAAVEPYHPLVQDDGTRLARAQMLSVLLLDEPDLTDRYFATECDPLPGVASFPGRSAYTAGLGVGEITAAEAGKANAARALVEETLGRGLEAVVAFGDNMNDLPLLLAAKEAYCPPDAPPEVLRQIAGRIAAPVEEGVAHHLDRLLRKTP
jgi:hydroxymethylpyrimidine pyrophosphatase-like HAD family hydrolase